MEELYEFVISSSPLSPKARCVVGFIFNSVLQVLQKHVFFVMLIYARTFTDASLCVIFMRTSLSWMAQTLKEDPSWIIQTSLCCFLPCISGFIFSWQIQYLAGQSSQLNWSFQCLKSSFRDYKWTTKVWSTNGKVKANGWQFDEWSMVSLWELYKNNVSNTIMHS